MVIGVAAKPLKDRTRRAIEQQAVVLFAEKGYQATSIQDIATAAGYSKATVLYQFAGKAELLAAVLEQPAGTVAALVEEASQLAPGEAQEVTITGFVDLAVRFRGLLNVLNDVIPTMTGIPAFDGMVEVGSKLARLLAGSLDPHQVALAEFAIHGLLGECRSPNQLPDDALRDLCVDAMRRLLTAPKPDPS
jgi:AcrR family transcriptional regulator